MLQVISLAIWVVLLVATIVLEKVFARRSPATATDEGARAIDRAMMMASALSVFETFIAQFFDDLRSNLAWVIVGASLAVVGLVLRTQAMRTLGPRFLLSPVDQAGTGSVVSSGPYRFVRHPGYLALYLLFLGLGLMLAPIVALLAEIPLIGLGSIRIIGEERVLVDEFGPGYLDYRGAVRWRVVPWVY